ncbi:hypothetical protein NF700_12775 [Sphingomonadaceae bacterium OTU29MARTA1]|nr:hypothetical protein NF700_12775 [Sphingomonadaceae bacterium OTU29MARTA1]
MLTLAPRVASISRNSASVGSGLLLDRLQDESGMILDLRRLAITTSDLRRWRAMREHQLPPADRARRADPAPPGCLSARQPTFHSSNDTVPQIT